MLHLLLVCVLFPGDDESSTRKPSSIAPSLPALTREEEGKLDGILDRFILADTGRLRGEEGRKAVSDFDKLGMEAVPALIRGLNRSAKLHHSCPVVMISKKLNTLLMSSDDMVLLEFARDEIGAGLERVTHARVLQDLRTRILLRKNLVARNGPIPARGPSAMTLADLVRAVPNVKGEQLRGVLAELAKRDDRNAPIGLLTAASSKDEERQKLGREMLDVYLARQSLSYLKDRLKDGSPEMRKGAIRVSVKQLELVAGVIERITDDNAAVRAEARAALKGLSKDQDFGPAPESSKSQQREARDRWQAWWEKQTENR